MKRLHEVTSCNVVSVHREMGSVRDGERLADLVAVMVSQFLRLRRLCSDDEDFQSKCLGMKTFFAERGYPSSLVDTALSKATHISRLDTLRGTVSAPLDSPQPPSSHTSSLQFFF